MPATRSSKNRKLDAASSSSDADAAVERLSDPDHADVLLAGLDRLRLEGKFTDVTLRVPSASGGGVVAIEAHANVLCALSPPLESMLLGPMASKDGNVELPSLKAEAVSSLVDYVYTGELELKQDTAWEVLEAADFLGLGDAKALCAGVLAKKLTPETALGAVEAAGVYHSAELSSEATAYAKEHFERLSEGEEWLALSVERVRALVVDDDLRVSSELKVVEALARWAKHKPAERTDAFAALFLDAEAVRLPQMSSSCLQVVSDMPATQSRVLFSKAIVRELARRPCVDTTTRPRRYLSPPGSAFEVPTAC
jgi:hypothetical protein